MLCGRLGLNALSVAVERIFDAMRNILWDLDILENLAQLLRNFFFTKIRSAALSPVAAATVINVLPLLHLCRHRAIVFCASQQAAKCEIVFPALAFVPTGQDVLHSLK